MSNSDEIDCWNQEGVGGDRSCEHLREHVHCRNCGVWSEGASRVMQRALPDDYRRQWAAHYAKPPEERPEAGVASLVFRIGAEWLALPAELAITVAEQVPAHRIPHRSGAVLRGLVNIRGQLYPCFSLGALLGMDAVSVQVSERRAYPRLLAVRLQQHGCALSVDEVHGIHRHAPEDLRTPGPGSRELLRHVSAILQVGDKIVGCLDAELLGRKLVGLLK